VDLNFSDRTDAEADTECRSPPEIPFQSRHRILDVVRIVDSGFEEDAAGADRFRILGDQRTLLCRGNVRAKQKRDAKGNEAGRFHETGSYTAAGTCARSSAGGFNLVSSRWRGATFAMAFSIDCLTPACSVSRSMISRMARCR